MKGRPGGQPLVLRRFLERPFPESEYFLYSSLFDRLFLYRSVEREARSVEVRREPKDRQPRLRLELEANFVLVDVDDAHLELMRREEVVHRLEDLVGDEPTVRVRTLVFPIVDGKRMRIHLNTGQACIGMDAHVTVHDFQDAVVQIDHFVRHKTHRC